MPMVRLRILDNRFQADVWRQALESEGIEHLVRTYEDTAYDGLFVTQKGYGALYVEEDQLAQAKEIDARLMAETQADEARDPAGGDQELA